MSYQNRPWQRALHVASVMAVCAALFPAPSPAYTVDPYAWSVVPQGGCGAIPVLVIHPKVADLVYIGADVGGLDRWDAVNQKWIPTLDFMRFNQDDNNFGVSGIAVDPSDTTGNVVYAAVGQNDWTKGEVMKSTDRGESWIRNSKGMFPYQSNGDQGHTQRLAVDPANSNIVYNGARDGLWRTLDGGVTWTKLTSAPTGDLTNLGTASGGSGIQMLILDPTSGTVASPTRTKRVFIAPVNNIKSVGAASNASPIVITSTANHGYITGSIVVISGVGGNTAANGTWTVTKIDALNFSLNGSTGNGAYTSGGTMYTGTPTDHLFKTEDGGTTWTVMSGAPVNANNAAITTTGVLYVTDGTGLHQYSGGASGTWTTISPVASSSYGAVAIDPFNNNNIIVCQKTGFQNPLWRSTDGGATWPYVSTPGSNETLTFNPTWYPGNWFRANTDTLAFDPGHQGTVWTSDFFAPWKTTNIMAANVPWTCNVLGHEEADESCDLLSPPSGQTLVYCGSVDVQGFSHTSLTGWPNHITIGYVAGQSGKNLTGGDFEEADPNFAAFAGVFQWDSAGSGGYTTDGGATYHDFTANTFNYGGRIAVSATSHNMVWMAAGWQLGSSYSTDNGATWTPIGGVNPQSLMAGNAFEWRSPLASDRKNGNKFYIYDWQNAKFDRSTDGGLTFQTVTTAVLPYGPGGWGKKVDLVANPYAEGDLWLSVQDNGLYHSTNSGDTWTKLSNVQNPYMVALGKGINATTPSIYVMGMVDSDPNEGIFRSDDMGVSWFKIDIYRPYPGRGPNMMVGDRRNYGQVYIGTNIGLYYGKRTTAFIPSVPLGVTATSGNTQITVNWTPSSGATSYNVKRATISGGPYTTIFSPTGPSYVNTGLTNGTTYYYVVSAVSSAGESANSAQASATPQLAIPAIPTGLSAIPGSTLISLYWTASPSATTYNVKRSTVTGGPYATVGSPASASYANTGLTNGTTYYYVVSAVNSLGESGNSAEVSAKPSTASAQIPFTSTAPVIDGSVDSVWSAAASYSMPNVIGTIPSGATNSGSWQALWDNTNLYLLVTMQDSTVVSGNDSIEIYVDGNNGKATSYKSVDWQWVFINGGGIQEYQNGVSGSNTTGIAQGQAAITGGWRLEAKIPWTTIGVSPFSSDNVGLDVAYNNYNVAGTRANKLFWFSTTDNDWTNPSLFGTAELMPVSTIPPAPTGLTATPGNMQVSLSWTASPGATSYNLLRSTVSGSGYATVATGIGGTGYTNTGLTNGTTYYFVVSATNAAGTSANSAQASATPFLAAPASLTATAGNTQVALSWAASSGATSYNIYRGTSAGGESTTAIATGIATTTYTNTGLTNGTAYFYKVKAVNSGGTSAYSNEASAVPISPNVHTGTWSCRGVVTSTVTWKNMFQEPAVTANQNYTASFWIKGSGAINLRILNGAFGSQLTGVSGTATSTWQQVSVTFNTGANTQMTYDFSDNTGFAGTFYIDDCFMGVSGQANVLGSPGFEGGQFASWAIDGGGPYSILQNP